MITHSASAVVDQLRGAGLNLALAPAGGLAVAPASHLTADLRALIRSSKAVLIAWLTANEATSHAPEPPDNPQDWRELAAAYHEHHFKCPMCMGAGRGSRYGQRCGVGQALWFDYSGAS